MLPLGLSPLAAISDGPSGKPLFHTFMTHWGLLCRAELWLAAAGLADKVRRADVPLQWLFYGALCANFTCHTAAPALRNKCENFSNHLC